MKDASRPYANDLGVVATIETLLQGPVKATLALFVYHLWFFILNDFTSEGRWVHVLDLLEHLVRVLGHFLAVDASLVEVVLHKLLDASELHVLEHELRHELVLVHILQVLMQKRISIVRIHTTAVGPAL